MSFWRKSLAITWKDVLSEARTREVVFTVLIFTMLVIVIYNFTTGFTQEMLNVAAPGLLWATFSFSGILSLNRAFVKEKENGCMEGLMAAPLSRESIYVGKVLGSVLFMLAIEIISLVLFTLLFNMNVMRLPLLVVTLLTTVGFASVGILFSALSANTRAREMVLPILFLPVVLPVVVAAVKASELALAGNPLGGLSPWLQIIIAFDVIFLALSYLVFTFVVEE
jgi:heme exporter protein B